jgi:hypothetical protein
MTIFLCIVWFIVCVGLGLWPTYLALRDIGAAGVAGVSFTFAQWALLASAVLGPALITRLRSKR